MQVAQKLKKHAEQSHFQSFGLNYLPIKNVGTITERRGYVLKTSFCYILTPARYN